MLFRDLPLRILDSALKHGYDREEISYALDMRPDGWVWEIDPDNDPPKTLFICLDRAGNPMEVVGGELADVLLIWHADKCRTSYLKLLPQSGEQR